VTGPISSYFAESNRLLQSELAESMNSNRAVDVSKFDAFRHRLLRQVSIEEKILMPALVQKLGLVPEFRSGLRKDHAGIAALCVPTPCKEWVENLRDLFSFHCRIEAAPDGFFSQCDVTFGDEAAMIVELVKKVPALKLAPFNEGPRVRILLARLLEDAGISETYLVSH
jgi:hypothetical protein